ncbi:MAG: hypothetical protein ACXVPU_07875 [Bacteroidia bacterium]
MKKNILSALLSLSAVIILSGCNSPVKKVENAEENLEHAKTELDQAKKDVELATKEYEAAKKEWEENIASNVQKIAELKTNIKKIKKNAQAAYLTSVGLLEQRNIELKKRLDEYKIVNSTAWKVFKTEFNSDITDLAKKLIDFQSKK